MKSLIQYLSCEFVLFSFKPSTVEVTTLDAIHSWVVQYGVVGSEGRKKVVILDPDTTTYRVSVEKGTQYRVRVAGRNVQQWGFWSPYMMAETPVDRKWNISSE